MGSAQARLIARRRRDRDGVEGKGGRGAARIPIPDLTYRYETTQSYIALEITVVNLRRKLEFRNQWFATYLVAIF